GRLQPGVYKVRAQVGRAMDAICEKIVVLDRDVSEAAPIDVGAPPQASAAPIPGTTQTHEYHVGPYETASQVRPVAFDRAQLSLIARFFTTHGPDAGAGLRFPHPFDGVTLHRLNGTLVADVMAMSNLSAGGDPIAIFERDIDP